MMWPPIHMIVHLDGLGAYDNKTIAKDKATSDIVAKREREEERKSV